MTLGFSRDDIGKFLPIYLDKGILKNDPFQILDQNGVGRLVRGRIKGRGKRPMLKCGICGEHGGEPSSVEFCHYAGLTYVAARRSACRSHVWRPPTQPSRRNKPSPGNRRNTHTSESLRVHAAGFRF